MAITPANAFAPGSPSSAGVAQQVLSGGLSAGISSLMKGMGMGALGIPGLSSSSSATSGDAYQGGSSTGDGFTVNYGNGVSQTGSASAPAGLSWVWIGAAALGALLLWKHKKSA